MWGTGRGDRKPGPLLVLALTLVGSAGLLAGPLASPAHAENCQVDPSSGRTAALRVIGLPRQGGGTIDYRTSGGSRTLTGPVSSRFGSAIGSAFIDADFCADLVVGQPGGRGGAVRIVPGGGGLDQATTLRAKTPADRFGTAVVAQSRRTAQQRAGGESLVTDIWVGAPGREVGGRSNAGAVDHFVVPRGGKPVLVETLTASGPVLNGSPEASAGFGSVLAAAPEGVLVGVPREDAAGKTDAGAAYWFGIDATSGRVKTAQRLGQGSGGVPGSAEAGDRFGAAVAIARSGSPRAVLIGAPGEDIGMVRDAGAVQVLELDGSKRSVQAGKVLDQNAAEIPGAARAGDWFGAAVGLDDDSCLTGWLVGAPGRDVAGRRKRRRGLPVGPLGAGAARPRPC